MKKFNKILSLALVLVMVLSLVPAITFGTVAEEITWTEVATADDLATKLEDANVQYIKITAATLNMTGKKNMTVTAGTVLDANGCVFTGVVFDTQTDALFNLTASSNGAITIKNLTIGSQEAPAQGMDQIVSQFTADNAVIKAIFENVDIYATLKTNGHSGVYARYPAGEWTFTDCNVYVDMTPSGNNQSNPVAGYIGRLGGGASFTNCTSNNLTEAGIIFANYHRAGGFIGVHNGNAPVTFEGCTNNATVVSGTGNTAGGFIGEDRNASEEKKTTLNDCTNNGVIYGPAGTTAEFVYNNNAGAKGVVAYRNLTPRAGTLLPNFVGYLTETETVTYEIEANDATTLVTALGTANATIKLLGNVDMTGKENITVASGTILDGNGKELTNVAVGTENAKYGLFNFGSNTGITVKNVTITGTGKNTLVATDNSESATPTVTFDGVTVVATLENIANESGAFGGRVKGTWTFKNCDVTVNVAGSTAGNGGAYFGRFWGTADFNNCFARGTIADAQGNHGGFIGVVNGAESATDADTISFQNCTNYAVIASNGSVNGQGAANDSGWGMAGFVGQSRGNAETVTLTLLNCTNQGTITKNSAISQMQTAQFVTGRATDGHVYYGNLTGKDEYELDNFANLYGSVEVLYDWAQLQEEGEYKIGPVYPAITGQITLASNVTIDGMGHTIVPVFGYNNSLFKVSAGTTITIKNLTIGTEDLPLYSYYGAMATYNADGSAVEEKTYSTTWENVTVHARTYGIITNNGAFLGNNTLGNHLFKNCTANIYATCGNQAGAFAGRIKAGGTAVFINCEANGFIDAKASPAAFVGKGDGTITLVDCTNNTNKDVWVANSATEGTNFFNYTAPQLKAVQETTATGEVGSKIQKIRFLAAVAENYITPETAATSPLKYGFTVSATVGGIEKFADRSFTLNNLYEAVTANEDGTIESVNAGDLGGTYISALVLTGVPAEGTVVFTVTPWMTYADGAAAVEGTTYTVTYTNGVFQTATPEGVTNPEL